MNPSQFRTCIVDDTLKTFEREVNIVRKDHGKRSASLASPAAVNLLMGTVAIESRFEHVRQLGGGPALSLFQIEPRTHDDLFQTFFPQFPEFDAVVRGMVAKHRIANHDALLKDMAYQVVIARLIYYRDPDPLPDKDDLVGLAHYYKRAFNTVHGASHVDDFIHLYQTIVEEEG